MKKTFIIGLSFVLMAMSAFAGTTVQIVNITSSPINDEDDHMLYYKGIRGYGSLAKAGVDSQLYSALEALGFNLTDGAEGAAWTQITGIEFVGNCQLNFADMFVLRYMAGFNSMGTGTTDKVSMNAESRVTNGNLETINLQNVTFVKEDYKLCFVYSSDATDLSNTWSSLVYFDPKYTEYNENRIPDYTFFGLPELKKVVLSSQCTGIGEYAFSNNTNLTEMDFSKCTQLERIERFAITNTQISTLDFSNCKKLTQLDEGCLSSNMCEMLILPPSLEQLDDNALEGECDGSGNQQYFKKIFFTGTQLPEFGKKVTSMFMNNKHGQTNSLTRLYVRESLVDELMKVTTIDYNFDDNGSLVFPLFEGNSDGLSWRTFSYFRPLNMSTITGLYSGRTDDMKAYTVSSYSDILGPKLDDAGMVTSANGVVLEGKGADGELYYCADETDEVPAAGNLLVGHYEGGFVPEAFEKYYYMLKGGKFVRMLNEGEMPKYKAYLDLSAQKQAEEVTTDTESGTEE